MGPLICSILRTSLTHFNYWLNNSFSIISQSHALQLRQAKLAFPSVYLTVGIFSDELCQAYQNQNLPKISHAERCEVVRHCRWVDEIISDAPWVVDDQFILQQKFDYIALAEGMSVDPACDKFRLGGYDALKKIGEQRIAARCISPVLTAEIFRESDSDP